MNSPNKKLLAVLAVSLVVNFAAIGFIGVRAVKDYVYQSALGGNAEVVETVPEKFRQAFRKSLEADRWALLKSLRSLKAARDYQHEILTAEKFSATALKEAQEKVRHSSNQLISLLHDALGNAALEVPDEVRREVPNLKFGQQLLQYLEEDEQS